MTLARFLNENSDQGLKREWYGQEMGEEGGRKEEVSMLRWGKMPAYSHTLRKRKQRRRNGIG